MGVLLQLDPLLKYMNVEPTKILLAEGRAVSKLKEHVHKSLKNQVWHSVHSVCAFCWKMHVSELQKVFDFSSNCQLKHSLQTF